MNRLLEISTCAVCTHSGNVDTGMACFYGDDCKRLDLSKGIPDGCPLPKICHKMAGLLTWSDREHAGPWDAESLAEGVLNCALDHYYDRTETGIPDGLIEQFPTQVQDKLKTELASEIEKHLSAVCPDWREQTVDMDDKQRAAFFDAVKRILAAYMEVTDGTRHEK